MRPHPNELLEGDSLWNALYLAVLGLASELSPKRQQNVMETWRCSAEILERRGHFNGATVLHCLAQDEWVEPAAPKKPNLYLVK